jgi:RNA-directed DNA polymerase
MQQALLQVLHPEWDPTFSAGSDGFRPGRSAHQAIARAPQDLQEGYPWVGDLDLEKFFDRVNHDKLMRLIKGRRTDRRALQRIDRSLKAGALTGDGFEATREGTPQGGPLSPLVANFLLDGFALRSWNVGATDLCAMRTMVRHERMRGGYIMLE